MDLALVPWRRPLEPEEFHTAVPFAVRLEGDDGMMTGFLFPSRAARLAVPTTLIPSTWADPTWSAPVGPAPTAW